MIKYTIKGDFSTTRSFLKRQRSYKIRQIVEKYAHEGVNALSSATPVKTGKTADSWSYEIVSTDSSITINWRNSNTVDGVPVAILIQYGHGTKSGGYVEGIDFVNPALKPIFDRMAKEAWEEVTS